MSGMDSDASKTAVSMDIDSKTAAVRPKPKRFRIKRWDAICLWSPDEVGQQICLLCNEIIAYPCKICKSKGRMECGVAHGACNHVFHDCCITKWLLRGQTTCPQTDSDHMWEVRRSGM